MSRYDLQSTEVIILEDEVNINDVENGRLILTNINVVFESENDSLEVCALGKIKYYNDKPYIVHKKERVTLFFEDTVVVLTFPSALRAMLFKEKLKELIMGQNIVLRSAGKVKQAIDVVDDTLGIDSVGTITGVIENSTGGKMFKKLDKRIKKKSKLYRNIRNAAAIKSAVSDNVRESDDGQKAEDDGAFEKRIEKIKKLKELLDMGAITAEEFEAKKKEMLEL